MAESAVRNAKADEGVPEEVAAPPLNIYQRINAVMLECGHLDKLHTHEIRKDGKKVGAFQYISHDDVTAHIRPAFIKHGIAVRPTVIDCKEDGNRTQLRVKIEFINIDDPSDFIEVESIGYGVDRQDKGPGKAFSYAVKYAYLKLLMLNSADDIELDDTEHDPANKTVGQVDAEVQKQFADRQAKAETLKIAIQGAADKHEINQLQAANKDFLMNVPTSTRDYFIALIEKRKADFPDEPQNPLGAG